ncbi:MAG: hypothetical protein ACR2RB_23030 [Gammaproteobacteria bacterium]
MYKVTYFDPQGHERASVNAETAAQAKQLAVERWTAGYVIVEPNPYKLQINVENLDEVCATL